MIFNSNPAKYLAGWAARNATATYREIQEKTMTTAIEQAKREMYRNLESVIASTGRGVAPTHTLKDFEGELESYLEQLRQQYEEMSSTARQRFESIQSLESVNQDLIEQLAKMTESRDMFRNLHQAATHSSIERAGQPSTSGQTSGDRASCDSTGSDTAILIAAIDQCKREVELWGFNEVRAKGAMRRIARVVNGDPDLANAMRANIGKCMHSFWKIGDDQFICTFCGVGK